MSAEKIIWKLIPAARRQVGAVDLGKIGEICKAVFEGSTKEVISKIRNFNNTIGRSKMYSIQ